MQKEAFFAQVPCITLRNETEWVETVQNGWNVLVGTETKKIIEGVHSIRILKTHPPLYGGGNAALQIIKILEKFC